MSNPEKSEKYICDRVTPAIEWYDRKSVRNKFFYYLYTFSEIILAASIPIINVLSDTYSLSVKIYITIVASILTVITTIKLVSRNKEKWISYRKTSELLLKNKFYFVNNVCPYDGENSFAIFVKDVEEEISKELNHFITNQKSKK